MELELAENERTKDWYTQISNDHKLMSDTLMQSQLNHEKLLTNYKLMKERYNKSEDALVKLQKVHTTKDTKLQSPVEFVTYNRIIQTILLNF